MTSVRLDNKNLGSFCRVHIRVRSAAKVGQVIAVTGSSHSLGHWDKTKAVHLVTNPEGYPLWTTFEPIIVPKGELVSYRYCVVEGGVLKGIESGIAHEFVPDELDTLVDDRFDLTALEGISGGSAEEDLLEQLKLLTKASSNVQFGLSQKVQASRLFFVCYHLPVTIRRTDNAEEPFDVSFSDSLIAKSRNSVSQSMKTKWVGTISVNLESLSPFDRKFLEDKLDSMNCIPISLETEQANKAYLGFCKTVMWPVFHNVDQLDQIHAAWNLDTELDKSGLLSNDNLPSASEDRKSKFFENKTLEWNQREATYYDAFYEVNRIFANTILREKEGVVEDDVIWVHDYHLMLLPKMLRDLNTQPGDESSGGGLQPGPKIKVIFFMHIPFPTSQIFRTMTKANELLESMVSADLLGFHAFDHARHFFNAAKRMRGLKSFTRPGGMLTLMVGDREMIVTISHVSIEVEKYDNAVNEPEVLAGVKSLREKYKGRKIIVGMDVCQRLSGVALKLAAFDKLLSDNTALTENGGVVLVQRCIRQKSRPEDEETTSKDIRKMVTAINLKHSQRLSSRLKHSDSPIPAEQAFVVDYEEIDNYKGFNLNKRVELWMSGDVFLLTAIREGLNTMPLEFIQSHSKLINPGVVVVSEFSTCASLLNGALKINPFNPQAVAETLEKALNMPQKDMEYRRERDMDFIKGHPSSLWAEQILNELDQLDNSSRGGANATNKFPLPLYGKTVLKAYEESVVNPGLCEFGSRLFVLDYGGTLLHKAKYDIYIKQAVSTVDDNKPKDHVLECIKKLSNDPRNIVMVVTGLTKLKLGNVFKDMPNVTLVTSNGLVYSWGKVMDNPLALVPEYPDETSPGKLQPNSSLAEFSSLTSGYANLLNSLNSNMSTNNSSATLLGGRFRADSISSTVLSGPNRCRADSVTSIGGGDDGRDWEFLDCNIDWKQVSAIALPIITRFTFRTNGTYLTPRIPGIGWSYFGADPEWGVKQAAQLKIELEAALANHDVKVVSLIQGSLEVVPRSLHKGILVRSMIHRIKRGRGHRMPGFAILMGDEESDDKMFSALYSEIGESRPMAEVTKMKAFTVTVGKRVTPAQFYVNDVEDVEKLLAMFAASPSTKPKEAATAVPN